MLHVGWSKWLSQYQCIGFMCAHIFEDGSRTQKDADEFYSENGHTQNEGYSAHSLIESNMKHMLKSEQVFTSLEYFIFAIQSAKKEGVLFHVNELWYEDFYDIKDITNDICSLNMTSGMV
ncbi:hypothetical protein PR048_016486 [Dryococelus australis]|uniref:Uncharacterized protein n=1 Tax=Dryococelus australis TaxID=614101 RepID=A0ABQ9HJW0_9NEOP|nr:hypothetical protein PR048_016486 [Dryococelus australis]